MKITVPKWVTEIEDDHLKVFFWFCDRMARQHGWDHMYTLHIDDAVRICDKRNNGLIDWLHAQTAHTKSITIGHMYDEVVCFSLPEPKTTREPGERGRNRVEKFYEVELEDQRARYVYIYLLGCLNQNLLEDNSRSIDKRETNAWGLKEFHLGRESLGYIKKPKSCEEEN
jgi:hypothetical protein